MSKEEFRERIEKAIAEWQRQHAVVLHRGDAATLVDALIDVLYVPPPIDPENIVGVG